MKATVISNFEWLDDYRAGEFMVRQYRAHHKNGVKKEEGLVFIMYEGQRIVNVKVPIVTEYNAVDRFVIEPSAKGLRVWPDCNGFMLWISWYYDLYPERAKVLLRCIFTNSKMPVSGLSAYIKDKLLEEEEQQ